jgi:crotonobetainyl-CoA:carnitine CoA-transferase CaiB-like acyl-CoA transferase
VDVNGETITLLNHPLSYDGHVPDFRGFALKPGADTRAVLEESGLSSAEINKLLVDKVIFSSE